MSALFTVTMSAIKTTVDALTRAWLRSQVKILAGCAPVSDEYARQIGADGYSKNANGSVGRAKKTIGSSRPFRAAGCSAAGNGC
jgi:5-methyltetrahydrofolate--homocysteine methyltransferase